MSSGVGATPASARTGVPPARPAVAAVPAGEDERLAAALQAARAGSTPAFEVVYRALNPRLRRYAQALAGQEADDVVAEAWLQIVRDLAAFTGDWDAFRGWTARIVRNRAVDAARSSSRRQVPVGTDEALRDRPSGDDTEAAAHESMSTAAALALVAALPPDQAEAVLLRTVVGLDARSAGAVLGKRAGAVRVAAHRGLKALGRRLEEGS